MNFSNLKALSKEDLCELSSVIEILIEIGGFDAKFPIKDRAFTIGSHTYFGRAQSNDGRIAPYLIAKYQNINYKQWFDDFEEEGFIKINKTKGCTTFKSWEITTSLQSILELKKDVCELTGERFRASEADKTEAYIRDRIRQYPDLKFLTHTGEEFSLPEDLKWKENSSRSMQIDVIGEDDTGNIKFIIEITTGAIWKDKYLKKIEDRRKKHPGVDFWVIGGRINPHVVAALMELGGISINLTKELKEQYGTIFNAL